MGTVYSAFDRERGAYVALKVAHPDRPEALLGLKREFRALGRANHPNLLSIYEFTQLGAAACLIGELIRGERLLAPGSDAPGTDAPTSDWSALAAPAAGSQPLSPTAGSAASVETGPVTRTGPLPGAGLAPFSAGAPLASAVVRERFGQLAAGLRALHAAGYAHRDVKPGNVLVTRGGRVVLVDFGAVASLGATGVQLLGTRGYIAPEAFEGATIAASLDWYSFGVLLYRALTGRSPGTEQGRPASPARLVDGVPSDLDELCAGLLSPLPDERPDGDQVAQVLSGGAAVDVAPVARELVGGLVGRRVELSVLRAALDAARSGRARLVRVRGEAGMGKTSLVREFVEDIDDAVVLRAACYECATVEHPALDSLADSVYEWLAARSPEERALVLPRSASVLPAAFPTLAALPELPEYTPAAGAGDIQLAALRRRALVALGELIGRAADAGAVVVVFDDLQWGDRETYEFVRALIDELADSRLLVVCAERGAATGSIEPSDGPQRGEVTGGARAVDVELGPLPGPVAEALARRWMDRTDGPMSARDIAAAGRGNPYFVRELARLHGDGGDCGGLELDDVVRARVDRLSADARDVLRVLALVGRPVPHGLLRAVSGLDGGAYLHALKHLRGDDLVTHRGLGDADTVDVFHSYVRGAICASLSDDERCALHGRIAAAIDRRDDTSPELAVDHWLGAGDRVRASRVAVRAAERAAGVVAFERAARWCRLSLDIGGLDLAEERDALRLLAHVLACAGELAASADALLAVAEREEPGEARRLRGRAAELLLRAGHVEKGRDVLDDVLAGYGVRVPRARAALAAAVVDHKLRSRLPARLPERCRVGDEELATIDALWSATVGMASVDPLLAAYLQTRNFHRAMASGDPQRCMQALWVQTFLSALQGNGLERIAARDCVELADELARRLDDPRGACITVALRGLVAVHEGRARRGATHLERAVELLRERGVAAGWDLSMGHVMWASAAARVGDWRTIGERLPQMLADTEGRDQPFSGALLRTVCVRRWLFDETTSDRARRELATARELADRSDSIAQAWTAVAEAIIELGGRRPQRALAALRSLSSTRHVFTLDTPSRRLAREMRLLALLATVPDNPSARPRVRIEIARLRAARQPSGPGIAALASAQLRLFEGDADGARRRLRRARAEFERIDADVEAAVVRLVLGRLQGGAAGVRECARATGQLAELGVTAVDRALAIYAPLVRCVGTALSPESTAARPSNRESRRRGAP